MTKKYSDIVGFISSLGGLAGGLYIGMQTSIPLMEYLVGAPEMNDYSAIFSRIPICLALCLGQGLVGCGLGALIGYTIGKRLDKRKQNPLEKKLK